MKHFMISLATLIISLSAQSAETVVYTCAPIKPHPLVTEVTIIMGSSGYTLTLTNLDTAGNKVSQSAAAEPYDDMTYIGYYSEALEVRLELDYPVDPQEEADLYIEEKRIPVLCR